ATLVKDAQRHGLRVLPVDVMKSDWECTLERLEPQRTRRDTEKFNERPPCASVSSVVNPVMRIGLRYVRGLREEAGRALVAARQRATFTSIDDMIRRVPQLRKTD